MEQISGVSHYQHPNSDGYKQNITEKLKVYYFQNSPDYEHSYGGAKLKIHIISIEVMYLLSLKRQFYCCLYRQLCDDELRFVRDMIFFGYSKSETKIC